MSEFELVWNAVWEALAKGNPDFFNNGSSGMEAAVKTIEGLFQEVEVLRLQQENSSIVINEQQNLLGELHETIRTLTQKNDMMNTTTSVQQVRIGDLNLTGDELAREIERLSKLVSSQLRIIRELREERRVLKAVVEDKRNAKVAAVLRVRQIGDETISVGVPKDSKGVRK